jgi:tRNA (guanine-N7-)-methyltransferase
MPRLRRACGERELADWLHHRLNRRVENPVRTAEYLARRDERRDTLRNDLAEILQGRTTLTLEVGAGHGHFLTDYARHHPSELCLGIDLIRERIERANRKRDRAGLRNLAFLQAEASEFLLVLPENVLFRRIFVLFPDPWPKRRHHKNRLMQDSFLSEVARRAPAGADLCFRTDDARYFSAAKAEVLAHKDWLVDEACPWPFERETVFQSRAQTYQSLVARRR